MYVDKDNSNDAEAFFNICYIGSKRKCSFNVLFKLNALTENVTILKALLLLTFFLAMYLNCFMYTVLNKTSNKKETLLYFIFHHTVFVYL